MTNVSHFLGLLYIWKNVHDDGGKERGNFPNVQHFLWEIGQFALKVKLMEKVN